MTLSKHFDIIVIVVANSIDWYPYQSFSELPRYALSTQLTINNRLSCCS